MAGVRRERMNRGIAYLVAMAAFHSNAQCEDAVFVPPIGLYCNTAEVSSNLVHTLMITATGTTEYVDIKCPVGEPRYPINGTISTSSNAITFHFTDVIWWMDGSTGTITKTWFYYRINNRDVLMCEHAQTWYLAKQIILPGGILIRLDQSTSESNPQSAEALELELLQ